MALTQVPIELSSTPGIVDNSNATAITIDSSENVGIGTSSPTGNLEIATSASDTGVDLVLDGNKTSNGGIGSIIFNNNGDSVGMIRSNRASANDAADMLFYTQATGGANTERMRILSTGGITFNGDTAAANALDDYEEGTFSARLRGSTAEPATLVTTSATYTKIGNRVFIIISFENMSNTGYSGQVSIDQLPFSCSQRRAVFYVGGYNGMTWTDTPIGSLDTSTSRIYVQDQRSGTTWAPINHSAGAGRYFWVTGHYITSA